jgi:lysyl-tRNA synthetase class 2
MELHLAPAAVVRSLGAAEQQLVAVARAFAQQARVMVFDEPTATLSAGEVGQLFQLIRRLREQRVAVAYISHRLEEIFELVAIVHDTEALVAAVVRAVAGEPGGAPDAPPIARVAGRSIDVSPPWPRMTVRDAMRTWAGVEVIGDEPAPVLIAAVRAAGIVVADGIAWDDAFFAGFLARVDPALAALDRPVILEDWPAPLAALARRKPDDPRTALRFEAYVGGIELANAFGELTDPVEQRARFEHDQAMRKGRGRAVYPIDDKLIAALAEGLPPSAGIALGFDRLVMLATGAAAIDDVLTFATAEL